MKIRKNLSKVILSISIIGIGAFLMSSQSYGVTVTTNMQVSVTVVGACTVAANPFNFPNYESGSASAVQSAQQAITVTCPHGQHYDTALSAGNSGSYTPRRMSNGINTINYDLYTEAGYTQIWGDGTGVTHTVPGTGTGGAQLLTVYGQISAGQTPTVGSTYNDVITVTVTY